jgi:type I restriction enzyme, S subunit
VQSLILKKKKFLAWVRKDICTSRQRLNGHTDKWEKIQSKDVLIEHKHKSTGNERVHSVSVHKGVIDQVEHLGRSFAAENKEKYNLVRYGDIIYTKSPTGDFPWGIIKQSRKNEDLIVSPLYGVFKPVSFDIGVILDFLFESYKYTSNYLNPLVQKGAKNTINITNSRFLEGHFYLPNSSAEAKEIANLIEACRNEIRILEFKLEKLKKQKRGLMQKLLNGEWRVNTSDTEAA